MLLHKANQPEVLIVEAMYCLPSGYFKSDFYPCHHEVALADSRYLHDEERIPRSVKHNFVERVRSVFAPRSARIHLLLILANRVAQFDGGS